MKLREREKILAISNGGDGPWVKVRHLSRVVVKGATKEDRFVVEFKDHNLSFSPEPKMLKGSGSFRVPFPGGKVRVRRVSGNSTATVLGYQEVRA